MTILRSEVIRAARALLRWEQRDLAEASSISLPTIKRLEIKTWNFGGAHLYGSGTHPCIGKRRHRVHRRERRWPWLAAAQAPAGQEAQIVKGRVGDQSDSAKVAQDLAARPFHFYKEPHTPAFVVFLQNEANFAPPQLPAGLDRGGVVRDLSRDELLQIVGRAGAGVYIRIRGAFGPHLSDLGDERCHHSTC